MVEPDTADPDRGLRICLLCFQSALGFSACKPLPAHDNSGFLLEFIEQLFGEWLFEGGVGTDLLLAKKLQ
jgi:hypothetical protein